MSGFEVLTRQAPQAAEVFGVVGAVPAPDLRDPAVAEFADQFGLDVSALDDEQRSAFLSASGAEAFTVVQQIYVADFVPRVRAVLDALFGASTWPQDVDAPADSWAALEDFMTAVARLRQLDPRATELVRLRGARLHDCAVCKSRRSVEALQAGADDATFAAVDAWSTSELTALEKAALGLTDALVLHPYDVGDDVLDAARRTLTEGQLVEVVLDVMRNAANKIAVALGADAATVTEGVELFTTDADGTLSVVGG